MKPRTLTMVLTLLVAGLAIGCSSAEDTVPLPTYTPYPTYTPLPMPTYTPYPTYAPSATSAPMDNLSENEAIGIARTYHHKYGIGECFSTKKPDYEHVNFRHTASASFKASGVWVVTAKTEWGDMTDVDTYGGFLKMRSDYITDEHPCTYVVDDATGKVMKN